ncbi:MAG TPA: hypothetical protein VGI97_13885 [Gemmatimonadaceae bacterium]
MGATVVAVLLGRYAWRHRVAVATRVTVPFALNDTAWRAVRSAARTAGKSCPPHAPVAILYVSRSCVHCKAELLRWAGLMHSGAPEVDCVSIAVVAPFAESSPADKWLPPEMQRALLWDRDGSIARALDARLVPVAAFVTSAGVVRARAVGESSGAATLERMRTLLWFSRIERGGH